MYKKILVPIDILEDELSQELLTHIEQIAQVGKPEIHFLTVIPNAELFFGIEFAAIPEKFKDSSERTRLAFIALQDMIKDAKIPDEQIVCNVGVGNAKDEILEYARQIDADLIAIASHRPNVSSYLLGSTASSIVRHAKMSVLVIR